MNYREKLRYFVIFGCVFFAAYIFAAARPLKKEFSVNTELTINLADFAAVAAEEGEGAGATQAPSAEQSRAPAPPQNEAVHPFRLKGYAGYFTESGGLLFAEPIPYKVAITNSFWALYNADAQKIDVRKTDGAQACTINAAGFPFFQGDRLYLFMPGGNSVAEYSPSGSRRWLYEGYTPITAFNTSANGAVIGFADGELVCIAPGGAERFAFYPGGSDYQIILGADIAPTKNLVACVCGVNSQRFVLSSYENNQHKVVFHEKLAEDFLEQAVVKFSGDSKCVYFQYKGGIGIVDCESLSCVHVPLKGSIRQIEELKGENLTLVLTGDGEKCYVYLFEDTNRLAGSYSMPAESSFLAGGDGCFFVGHDGQISKISIARN